MKNFNVHDIVVTNKTLYNNNLELNIESSVQNFSSYTVIHVCYSGCGLSGPAPQMEGYPQRVRPAPNLYV